jgi:NADH-quinone oxidoreductase subunit N
VLATLLAQGATTVEQVDLPAVDWHAFAPEVVLAGTFLLALVVDVIGLKGAKPLVPVLAGMGLLATMIPIVTLALESDDTRTMFGGAFVVDDFALVMKALFVLSGYVVVLMSMNTIAEGDYWESEYYELLLSSILGMVVMASARDLITVFIALELLSIPAYMLATWRKRDAKSNEGGLKYYLMGVFATGVLLYGMSLLYGVAGSTLLVDISAAVDDNVPIISLGVVFVIVGFAFKVSAVPFHTWAPDTYEGAPTPVTAFLAVASKTAGFVALLILVYNCFYAQDEVWEPMLWAVSAATMTVGNLIALRQTNVVRLLAYSGVAQAGYMLAPLAVASEVGDRSLQTILTYLVIYAAMNLGAFAVIIAVARKTRSAELEDLGGVIRYAPTLAVFMGFFLFSLAGIPPFGGWYAKLGIFQALAEANTVAGYVLAAVVGVNSVIALFYYVRVARTMTIDDPPAGDVAPLRVPPALTAALLITVTYTFVSGIFPQSVARFTDEASLIPSAAAAVDDPDD